MNIFHKRPLSLILCIALGTFALAAMTLGSVAIGFTVAIFILAVASFFIKRSPAIAKCALVVALLASLFAEIYLTVFTYRQDTDEPSVIEGVIDDVTSRTSYKISADITTHKINGTNERRKIRVEFYDAESFEVIEVGAVIEFVGTLEGYELSRDDYYITRGISAFIRDGSGVSLISREPPSFSYRIKEYRKSISEWMCTIAGEDAGGFLAALLLGERDYLDTETALNFERLGITHVLAISGLHLSILTAFLMKLLSIFRLNKKIKSVVSIVFVLLYMGLTGFSSSVTRAGIMVILSLTLYLLSSTYDSITALFVSVSVIVLINPLAIFDLSLRLSAGATFGVLVGNEYLAAKFNTYPVPKVKKLISPLAISLFAVVSILSISVASFSSHSIVSPLATILYSFLAEIYMILGIFATVLGALIPIGRLLTYLYPIIDKSSAYFSGFEWVTASVNFPVAKILAIVITVALFGFAVLKIRKRTAYLCSLLSLYSVFLILCTLLTQLPLYNRSISAYSSKSDAFLITDSHEIGYIDISGYTVSSASYKTNYFESNNLTYIDKYVFTHYTKALPAFAEAITADIKTDAIYLPSPQNDGETEISLTLEEAFAHRDTRIVYYEIEEALTVGDIGVFESYRSLYGDGAVRIVVTFLDEDKLYTYASSGVLEDKSIERKASEIIAESDTVIFGCHGKSYSIGKFTVISENIKRMIVFSDKLYIPEEIKREYPEEVIIYPDDEEYIIR